MLFLRTKVSYRLGLGFGLLIIIIIIDSGFNLVNINTLSDQARNLYNHPFTVSTAMLRIDGNIIKMHRAMKNLVHAKDNQEIISNTQQIVEFEQQIFTDLNIVHERFLGDKNRVDKLRNAFRDWKTIREEVIALMKAGENNKAVAITKGKETLYIEKLLEKTDEFVVFAKNKADSFFSNVQIEQQNAFLRTALILLCFVLFGIVLAFWNIRSILLPINKLIDTTEKITNGDLSARVGFISHDELGQLGQSFDQMTEQTQELVNELKFQKLAIDEHAIVSAANVKGNIIYVNDKFCSISGYSREALMGQNHRMVKSNEHSPEFYKNLWSTITHGRTWHGEMKNLTKKGEPYWVRATIVPFINKQGKPFRYVSIRTDITVMKAMEKNLLTAKEVAEESTRTKSDFLANMSHEIRTPMNAIIGMSHLALQTEMSNKQRDYLTKIQSSSNTLLGIINDILDFSKIEAGKLTMESIDFHLDDVLDSLATIVSVNVEKKGLELIFSRPENVPDALIGDPTRLGQILINLCNNAVKFTECGEVFVGTEMLHREGEKIQLKFTIKDTGIGMTPEQTSKLFSAFMQADTSTTRKYAGTGLGLSISKKLVEMMDGEIWVESDISKGSQFYFTAWFGRKTSEQRRKSFLSSDLQGTRVLVVDDNASSREILCDTLKYFGFEATAVNSGQQAIQALTEDAVKEADDRYLLILMDWKMPGMNGLEASKKIKESHDIPAPPKIILVTAYGREEVLDESEEKIIDGYLLKPVNPSLVLDAIMNIFSLEGTRNKAKRHNKARDVDAIRGILGAKVLLAEDNLINQQVAIELLEGNGLIVTVANNGREAVRVLQTDNFDVVLMDIQMPEMDGMEATAEIRKDARYQALPILAMTAHAMTGDREKSLEAGMNDHLTKPINPDKLFDAMVKWIPAMNRDVTLPNKTQTDQNEVKLPDHLAGIDITSGLKRVGGNKKLFKKLLKDFYQDYKEVSLTIRRTIEEDGDSMVVQRLAHTLKGVAGAIGAENLYQAALNLETGVKAGRSEEYQAMIAALECAMEEILQGLASLPEDESPAVDVNEPEIPNEPIDPELLKPLFEELMPLLKTGHSKSTAKVAEIRELAGAAARVQLASIDEKIDDYEYEEALETLIQLAESLNITMSSGVES